MGIITKCLSNHNKLKWFYTQYGSQMKMSVLYILFQVQIPNVISYYLQKLHMCAIYYFVVSHFHSCILHLC